MAARDRRALVVLVVAVAVILVGYYQLGIGRPEPSALPTLTTIPLRADPDRPGASDGPGRASWTPWPQALHDAQHTGASENAGPTTGRIRWTRRLEGNVTPGPVVAADGTIYAASNAGVLHALDPGSGEDRWTFDGKGNYGVDTSTSAAVLPDGIVLWPGPGGRLYALSPQGRLLWDLPVTGQVTSPAVTSEGLVAVGGSGGRLLALRPTATGPHVAWDVELTEQTYGSPVISADGRTVYQSVSSGVVAVRDGVVLWRSSAPTNIVEVSPAVAPDGTVVIGTNDPFQYGLDPADGTVRWRFRRGPWTYSSPGVTADGIVYFGDHANRITGLDARDGSVVFRYQGTRQREQRVSIGIWTSVLVDAEHRVYAGTRQGYVYGVDAQGELLWQISTGATVDSYPALTADGALVIGTTDGELLAIADD